MGARAWWVGAGVWGVTVACETPPPPGDLVGRYQITGTMSADTCGPGLGANRTLTFGAELREDADSGYWLFGDRRPTPGVLETDGSFLFQLQGGWTLVNPVPERGYAGCRVAQVETIEGKVARTSDGESDAGIEVDPDTLDLEGLNTIDVVPLAGDDCTPALSSQGGPLLALPCRVTYTLRGSRTDVDD